MITFNASDFRLLAAVILGDKQRRQELDAILLGDDYQEVHAELNILAGDVEAHATGVCHNLDESFARVNAAYFQGELARPRLIWSSTFTFRKFGHYDALHDTVMINASVDKPEVPSLVVDYLMYHELLHKKLGTAWNGSRRSVHSPEYKQLEQQFLQITQAKTYIHYLATGKLIRPTILSQSDSRLDLPSRVMIPSDRQPKPLPSKTAPLAALTQVGRNAPCPCGSGRKYKMCCGQQPVLQPCQYGSFRSVRHGCRCSRNLSNLPAKWPSICPHNRVGQSPRKDSGFR